MLNIFVPLFKKLLAPGVVLLTLTACSPQYDWRQIQSAHAPFSIAMPAKPSTYTRKIDLRGTTVEMTMSAAEIGENTFAVGTAELPDAIQAQAAVQAMQLALVNNIQGKIRNQKMVIVPRSAEKNAGSIVLTEIDALGGQQRVLFARFAANDRRVYQLVATGPESLMTKELAQRFFDSFMFN